MERITISLRSELAAQFDAYIEAKGYSNRSEAMRDLIRDRLESERLQGQEEEFCIGVLSYVYAYDELDLPHRLAQAQHESHDLCISSTCAQLDHTHRFETILLRGWGSRVRTFAESIIAQRGVRHGRLQLIQVEVAHDADALGSHDHLHTHPLT